MSLRRKVGAGTGLFAALLLVLVLIGTIFYFVVRLLGGDRQAMNATDAGALNACRAMLAVSVPESSLAPELQGFGVNVPAAPANGLPSPSLPPGAPDAIPTGNAAATQGTYNILAYNRAAGAATLIALNAVKEGTSTAIQNASNVINGTGDHANVGLKQFGQQLNSQLIDSGQLGNFLTQSFQDLSQSNNVNMLGQNSSAKLQNDLSLAHVATGINGDPGKSNVYFNPLTFNNDPFYFTNALVAEDTSGSIQSDTRVPYTLPPLAPPGLYQTGQNLLTGYKGIVVNPGAAVQIPPIYLCAMNPASTPHLIDAGRFQSAPAQLGPNEYGYAPVNALSGETETTESYTTGKNLLAAACAVVGGIFNEYPVTLVHDYVRISNGPDARIANAGNTINGTNLTLANMGLVDWVDGSGDIFNQQLYGPGLLIADGGGFAIYAPYVDGAAKLFLDWYQYDQSTGSDQYGHDPNLYPPNLGDGSPPYSFVGTDSGQNGNEATLQQFLNITNPNIGTCSTTLLGQPLCDDNYVAWYAAYYGSQSQHNVIPAYPQKAVTCLEAGKAEILTEWEIWTRSNRNALFAYSTTGSEFANDSGSDIWSRTAGCAVPTETVSVVFGTPGTPYQLLEQLKQNGAPIDPDDTSASSQWYDPTQVLGQLLQRCREIWPPTQPQDVLTLLKQNPLPLGTQQYIYLPANGNALAIGTSPSANIEGLPEFTSPGSTSPDGNPVQAPDTVFAGVYPDGPLGNQLNAQKGILNAQGIPVNTEGDCYLHDDPFEGFSGSASTYDYVQWTPSTGTYDFLGDLSFYNHLNINGKFCGPN
jgi:hypothetical protein